MMASGKWMKLHSVESIFEMDTLRAAFEKEGIEYVVKEHKDTAYDGLFVLQKGYATFYTKEEDEPTARAIIKGISIFSHVVLQED
jgi:hypothetical protein